MLDFFFAREGEKEVTIIETTWGTIGVAMRGENN